MAKAVVILFSFLLLLFTASPILFIQAYFVFRPLVQPFGLQNLKLLGLPVNWPIAGVVLLNALFLALLRRHRFYPFPYNSLPLYALLVLSTLSIALSIDAIASLGQTLKYLNAVSLVVVAINSVHSVNDVRRVYGGVALSGLLPMAYGFYQYFTEAGFLGVSGSTDRIASFFGFANLYGIFLALIIFCAAISLALSTQRLSRLLFGAILTSAIISTFLSLNRGTWIALGVGFTVASVMYYRRVSLTWIVSIGSVLLVTSAGLIIDRFMQLESKGLGSDTFTGRLEMWRLIVASADQVPILGFGSGTAQQVLEKLFQVRNVPHNDYLRLFLEMGLLGSAAYIILLGRELFWQLSRKYNEDTWLVGYFTLAMLVYWIVISAVQNVVHDVTVLPMFLVLCHLARRHNKLQVVSEKSQAANV